MQRANGLSREGHVLSVPSNTHYVFYGENTSSMSMDLSAMKGTQPAVAVDTKKEYREIEIGTLSAKKHVWKAPYQSDWVLAVGDFGEDPSASNRSNNPNGRIIVDPEHPQWLKGRYNLNMSEAADWGTGAEARKKSWACAMGGAYIMILGMDIAATPGSDLENCGRLVRFFESTNFNGMSPRDELGCAGTKYILARPGRSYIAYTPELKGEIGLKNVRAGRYTFVWFDGATGKQVTQENVTVSDGEQSWNKPKGIGSELAVYIRRIGR